MTPYPGKSQEGGGLTAELSVSQSLRWSDNPDFEVNGDSGLRSVTGLGFGLTSQTRNQSFDVSLRSGFETNPAGGSGSQAEFRDPSLSFGYELSNRNSSLSLGANFLRSQIGSYVPLVADAVLSPDDGTDGGIDDDPVPDLDEGELIFDSGTRLDYTLRAGAEFGTQAPFGGSFSYNLRGRDISGASNTSLYDSNTQTARLALRFDLSPRITSTLTLRRSLAVSEDVDQTERTSDTIELGSSVQLDPVSSLSFGLSSDRIETVRLSGDTNVTGTGLRLSYNRDLQRGSYKVSFSSNKTPGGERQDNLKVQRSLELSDGSLSFGAGITKVEGLDPNPDVSLSYKRSRADQSVSVNLAQSILSDINDNEVASTQFSTRYDYTINSLSSVNASLGFVNRTALTSGGTDEQRLDMGVSYRRELGQDWGLVSGYTFAKVSREGTADRQANTLSMSLQRTFSYRP